MEAREPTAKPTSGDAGFRRHRRFVRRRSPQHGLVRGVITSWNHAAHRMYGYAADEAVGKPISLLVVATGPMRWSTSSRRSAAVSGRVEHYETVRVRKDGTTCAVS